MSLTIKQLEYAKTVIRENYFGLPINGDETIFNKLIVGTEAEKLEIIKDYLQEKINNLNTTQQNNLDSNTSIDVEIAEIEAEINNIT